MAIGVILNGPGISKEQYEQISEAVMSAGTAPIGLQSHVAGLTDDGVHIVEVWESQDALDSFFGSTVAPVLAKIGVDFQPTFFQVINEIRT